jgi:hypothetical protein
MTMVLTVTLISGPTQPSAAFFSKQPTVLSERLRFSYERMLT